MVAILLVIRSPGERGFEWREFFLVGIGPLVGLTFLRRRKKETPASRGSASAGNSGEDAPQRTAVLAAWGPALRRNLVLVEGTDASLPFRATGGGLLRRAGWRCFPPTRWRCTSSSLRSLGFVF